MRSTTLRVLVVLVVALAVGQVLALVLNPAGYAEFLRALPLILSQIAFWGPIVALIAGGIIVGVLRLLGFPSIEAIRSESVDQNNPTPAIVFVGTLIASLLFLALVIRP